jgi:hypothetical protein
MSYNKTNWLDRAVQYPQRFTRTSDGTYDTLVPAPGTVTQSGTPITANAGKYIIAVGHFQKDSICEFTTIVAKTLTYLYNTIGTVTVNGLSGDARFTVICLS